MNRETKRRMKREQMQSERAAGRAPMPPPQRRRERPKLRQFLREIQGELRRVVWASKQEIATYSLVVVVIVTILTGFVFVLDWVFAQAVLELFRPGQP